MRKLFVFVIVVSLVACKSTKQEESKPKVLQEANQEKAKDSSLEKASEEIESLEKNKSIEKESEKIYEKESTSQKEDLQENQIVEKKSVPENVFFAQALQNFLSKGDIEGALSSFNALPENLSNDVDIKILHSSLLLSAGKTKEAEIIAEELQAQNPNNVDVLELSMSVAAASGNKTKTNALIKQLLSIDKNNVQANIHQAGMHTLNKKYKLAFNCYNAALQKDGNNVDALFGCGQSSYYLGKFSDAKKYLEKAISIDKTHSMSYAFLGKVYSDYENYKKASSYVQDAIKCDDSRPEFYTDLGFYLHKQNRLEEAEAALTKAIELEKDYFLAYSYRASLYKQQKQYMKALYDYYKVANTNSKYYYAYEEIGLLEWHENDFKRSRASFERALNNNPKSVSYKLMIAATYLKEKNLFEAKNFLQKAMKGVDRASIEYDMLRLYHDQGGANAESRMSMRIKTVAEPSAKGRMLFYLGLYYELKNMPRLAEEYFKQVTEMQTPLFFEYEIAEWSLQK